MSLNAVSPAIQAAAIFLTHPLMTLGTHSPAAIITLRFFLQNTLASNPNTVQLLSFTPSSLPPLSVQLACVACSISWADWLQALGGSAFDLIIEPTRVYVIKKATGQIGVVWIDQTIIQNTNFASSDTPAVQTPSEPESDVELGSPITRPSSRSSIVSDSGFSFSSRSSTSSKTSMSSISPMSAAPEPKSFPSPTPKATPTRYLYQGGVSTVLTGGVMLGSGGSLAVKCTPPVDREASPSVSVYTPPHRSHAQAKSQRLGKNKTDNIVSWRRGASSLRVAA